LKTPYDATQEVLSNLWYYVQPIHYQAIFPSQLQVDHGHLASESLCLHGRRVTLYCPSTLAEMLTLRQQHPDALLIGNAIMAGMPSVIMC
jgi:hypothetical protein